MDIIEESNEVLDSKLLLTALVALRKGDFSVRLPSDLTGMNGKIADTLNDIIENSDKIAQEIVSVSRVVGHDGRLLQRAAPPSVGGGWATIINSVNALIDDLVRPTTEMARVIGAVAKGDLSQNMALEVDGRPLRGQFLRAASTANTMVDQLSSFASEVTRVAREVGTEGKLGGQANVPGVAGTWKDLTDSVNSMAGNLTSQVRNIAEVTTAVANGDLSKKITVDVRGEILQLKDTINTMVDQLRSFASEVTRVAREVGTEGKLGGQAYVPGVGGTWKDLTDNVNFMASNLTGQVRNIAEVTTAVANGDLSKKIAADAKGEILQLKDTINVMVDQLSSFASEVTRVAREVGTEGKLGGQAQVKGVGGTWKDLTDSVNSMAGNLTGQVRNIAEVTTAVANGDLGKKITADAKGEILELKNTINVMVDQLSSFASEVTRVAREVGTEGKLGGQAQVKGVGGTWKDLTENVNSMAGNLTRQVRNIAEVTTAVANGNLSKKITADAKGEILELKDTINVMVDQLSSFASEVTRVAREVGTEGKLGGQAHVPGVAGTWKDLTDSVNSMAGNLTGQVRNIAEVTTAVANGDLSKKIAADAQGEILQLKDTINVMVDQLSSFASEVTRVAREVGTEGKLGGQANVPGVAGTWKDLTDNVNSMAGNLTGQVRNIAEVTTAVANGDLSKKIAADAQGEILQLKDTINVMVDQLSSFASEVTRVAREVGTEGKLGGQAQVKGVAGTWKDLTDNVNFMASNLTGQVRNIAEVTTAVANGELSKTITADAKGEILELKNTINVMVDQLNSFASEVTRVAREVGTEGKLGGQANVPGVAGTWKDLTDSVNSMAGNLTGQVRNIADVTTAVATGDLSKKITADAKGEILELKDTINVMVDQLSSFASEVTRVAREVGTEGKLGGQAQVKGVAGTWKDLTDNVNFMASNLTGQVRNIAEVTTAVANGDLSKKITADVKGEILEMKDTINVMVDQLSSFASEVTRVAREVGTEGKLGGQANVPGVAGTWKDLTDSVNSMAGNLTSQVRNIADVTTAVANGDLSKKITVDVRGEILQLKDTINTMVDQLRSFASEVTRVAREVGTEGRLGGQANVPGASGTWKDLTDNVNFMASNLTGQVRNIAEVTTAVANGDLSKKITVDVKGEILELKDTINVMVDQLSSFASEVTRVAREVGTEGKLGGQAQVKGVGGTWKDLTENVNFMAANLTAQVRGIAGVVTAVAKGDMKKKLTVAAQGEIASLANTINEMTDTLAVFADQVTGVARDVGVEGKLGGQASVPGASGTWKDLTENVNQLAANLTTQVRAIAEVATAVTRGDLSRSIQVEARGEVSDLKDNINEMIRNLKETTQKNAEQDWLKTNLARFTRLLQGQRDIEEVTKLILSELAPLVSAHHGVFFMMDAHAVKPRLKMIASYGYRSDRELPTSFAPGEGLVGQCAIEKQRMWLTNVPRDYIVVSSGLGSAPPTNIVVLPILFEQEVKAVIEIASLDRFTQTHMGFLDQLMGSIGAVLNTIEANSRTESLLTQSQSLAQELQQTNQELAEKARLLSDQNSEVERKNREVEQAKLALEDKATQLALSSKYKSEFLANMSHELRTPLNSLLILAQQLGDNPHGNLSQNQVEYAKTIHGSGSDLLTLINDILDLSKIESGTVTLEVSESRFPVLATYVERTFRHMAEAKLVKFFIEMDPSLPVSMMTDTTRLQQILKNLLSNAFKFTANGQVTLKIGMVSGGWTPDHPVLSNSDAVVSFSVTDTGVGISADKLQLIFEAFQQADGSTARRYGGTGLGLSISRELARLLGGEIRVTSVVGSGSTFTLFLPYNNASFGAYQLGMEPAPLRQIAHDLATSSPASLPIPGVVTLPFNGSAPRVNLHDPDFDDRNLISAGDQSVMIVEDDTAFANILLSQARARGLKGIVTFSGESVLTLARDYLPIAILLDIDLPDTDGFTVLDRLKRDPATRHIPVHVISSMREREKALRSGAISYLNKPVKLERIEEEFNQILRFMSQTRRSLLIVEDDEVQRLDITQLIGDSDLELVSVDTGAKALEILAERRFDCVVLDLSLPDMDGFTLLDTISKDPNLRDLPVVVYTAAELSRKEVTKLKRFAKTIVVKDARSRERLLDETALFLHRSPARLPDEQRRMLEQVQVSEGDLAGRSVLVVDDDLRNIFALTTVLERYQMKVHFAENGKDGIKMLEETEGIEIVLMDIMMPEMDGYDTMRAIRKIARFKSLPIITLTAKAMKGDRDKCIAAGASDYITKPVDVAQLLSLMRVWLGH
ncbi:HAMP domain-containing protein [Massilia sp. PAMC28688]|uniref:HAMP domain-containing protein n=1 Tax=Massilia sp. PAMC28688 TaxID=2861283 RepID=UPI001C638B27|nr:HAMP domain-containing protein [Massilia sp. PAMC28688]QYF91733.1 HAMP domain-containing protein [Massilia sp. PAMC28688]